MSGPANLTRLRFGRLRVIARAPLPEGVPVRKRGTSWSVICDCGRQLLRVPAFDLRGRKMRSCGFCVPNDLRWKKHGGRDLPEYGVYRAMLSRCHTPTDHNFARYGARGIVVADRWRYGEGDKTGFECFISDMGRRPKPGLTLERVDNDGPYASWNCRWATARDQQLNTKRTLKVVYRGETMTLVDAMRVAGGIVALGTARQRIRRGWPVALAVETPAGAKRPTYH